MNSYHQLLHILKRCCVIPLAISFSCCVNHHSNCRSQKDLVDNITCLYKDKIKQREDKEKLWLNPPAYIRKALCGTSLEFLLKTKPSAVLPMSRRESPQTTNLMIDLLDKAEENRKQMGWNGIDIITGDHILKPDYTGYSPSEIFLCYFIRCASECDRKNDYNLKQNGTTTPLMMAALMGNVVLIQYLVDHGAKLNETTVGRWDSDRARGKTALHFAALGSNMEAYTYLLQLGANPDIKDGYGKRACDYFISGKDDYNIRSISLNGRF